MPDVIDAMKATLPAGCQTPQCRKGSCSLSMNDAPTNRVLIDLDSDDAPVGRNQERCDFIFVAQGNDTRVAALELKGGKLDASEVVRQLRAGARFAERIVPADAPVRFAAIAVHGGGIHRKERVDLLKPQNRITFRGESGPVNLARCGDTVDLALRSSGLRP